MRSLNKLQPNDEHLKAIEKVKRWLEEVVIAFNFCPFARKEHEAGKVRFSVFSCAENKPKNSEEKNGLLLQKVLSELQFLDEHSEVETSLLILSDGWLDFYDYLDLLDMAEQVLVESGCEGVYQLASFHPDYLFAEEEANDASHFTNRSPLPVIHIIREASIEKAVESHPNAAAIPERNQSMAREKGCNYWQQLLKSF